MKNIVNIVNFVRAIEPRPVAAHIDIKEPLREQVRMMKEYGFKGTFLLQYDTLIDPEYRAILDPCRDFCEFGLWMEIVKPQVEAVGLEWRGRYAWDWHNDVGFLIGYEPSDRIKLIDEAMEKFREIYGYYPRSVGSWHIDAISLRHLAEKYHISASCNCRDQVGTDGYTIQGGYYNHAYYPSVYNMLSPAVSEECRIDVPVFRMLGSDPIYVYDYQAVDYGGVGLTTLEPAWHDLYPAFPDWYYGEVLDGSGISFGYTQTGQENSFGWRRMKNGFECQFKRLKELKDGGRVEILTLAEAGEWFKSNFKTTPPTSYKAMSDWNGQDRKSVWYSSAYYRASLFYDSGVVRLRDIYIFDETFRERYLDRRCTTNFCEYRNLPVMDSALYSNRAEGIVAGVYLTAAGEKIVFDSVVYSENEGSAKVDLASPLGRATVMFSEESISLTSDIVGFRAVPICDLSVFTKETVELDGHFENYTTDAASITMPSLPRINGNLVKFDFAGKKYAVRIAVGRLEDDGNVSAADGEIKVTFERY